MLCIINMKKLLSYLIHQQSHHSIFIFLCKTPPYIIKDLIRIINQKKTSRSITTMWSQIQPEAPYIWILFFIFLSYFSRRKCHIMIHFFFFLSLSWETFGQAILLKASCNSKKKYNSTKKKSNVWKCEEM